MGGKGGERRGEGREGRRKDGKEAPQYFIAPPPQFQFLEICLYLNLLFNLFNDLLVSKWCLTSNICFDTW